jgi:hypothetical protein
MRNSRDDNVAERIAQKYNVSKRTVYRAGEYATAIDTLVIHYGQDVKHAILDGKVKLTHKDVVLLASAVAQDPRAYQSVADSITAHKAAPVKQAIAHLKHRSSGDSVSPEIIRFEHSVEAAADALKRHFDREERSQIIRLLQE